MMQFQFMIDPMTEEDSENFIKMIEDDGTIRYVPNNPENRHWQIYQQWLADGNTTLASE